MFRLFLNSFVNRVANGAAKSVCPTRRRARVFSALSAMVLLVSSCGGGGDGPTDPVMSINITSSTLEVGENVQLSAVNARGTVSWTSSNTAVATVVSTGFVTAVGAGSATITASTPNQSATSAVTVLQPPQIAISVTAVDFTAQAGGDNPAVRTVAITNSGQGTLDGVQASDVTYGAGQPGGWLSTDLSSTAAPSTLTLTASVAGLIPGTYTANVSVTAPSASNSPRVISVSFVVTAAPTIELSATTAGFTAQVGGAVSAPVAITVTSGSPAAATGLAASVAYAQGGVPAWLTTSLSATTTPSTLTLTAAPGAMTAGTYTATVTLTSPSASNAPRTIQVTLTIATPPAIALSATVANFAGSVGGANPATQAISITNGGGGSLSNLAATISYATGTGWLSATLNTTTAPATLTLQAITGALPAGVYSASVQLGASGASNSPRNIAVSFVVTAGAIIAASPTALSFSGGIGASPASQVVAITNAGGGALTGLSTAVVYGSGSGWLSATLNTGTAPATLTVQPTAGALPAGTYTATVRVSSAAASNSPLSIPITYTIAAAPSIVLSQSALAYSVQIGAANPPSQQVTISNGGGGSLSGLTTSIIYPGSAGWLTATLNTTTAPATLTLTASRGALAAGTYTANVNVSSSVASNSPRTIEVTFTVTSAPAIGTSASAANFTRTSGTSSTTPTGISVSNTGGGTLTGLAVSIIYVSGPAPNSGWLTATLTSANAPTTLNITANAGTSGAPREPGTYTATVRLTSAVASNSPRDIAVTFNVPVSLANNIYSQLYPTYCSGCHFSGGSQPNLSTVTAFRNNMVNVGTTNKSGYSLATTFPTRIVPGNANGSYLTYQLAKSGGAFGMPTGAQTVPASLRTLISTWINQGAPNN